MHILYKIALSNFLCIAMIGKWVHATSKTIAPVLETVTSPYKTSITAYALIKKELRNKRSYTFKQKLGSISYRPLDAWISRLEVAPSFRGSGIGKRLFNEAITRLKKENIHLLAQWIALEDSIPFYEKQGALVAEFQALDDGTKTVKPAKHMYLWLDPIVNKALRSSS